MTWISLILAIAKAIPVIDRAIRDLVQAYVQWKIKEGQRDLAEALIKMIETGDQRDLEREIGSPNAGKPAQDQDGVRTRPNP